MIIRTSGRDLDELKRFIDVAKANEETEIRVRFPTHIDAARRYAREKGKLRVHIMQRS